MSAVLNPAAPATPAATSARPLKVTQARVLRSEWTKFRSLRSTLYTLLAAVALMIGIGALFSAVNANQYHTLGAADKAAFNPVSISLTGTAFAVVAFGVLGVLLMSSEYSTGMIRASLTAVPRRLPVLWGKLAVFAAAILSISLVASFASFFLGQVLLSSHHLSVAITAPGALRSVIGAALYVTVAGLIGVTLGALFRNTAAGIATFAGAFFVIPPLASLLPASISDHVAPYLPSNAGQALWGGAANVHNALSPWTGFAESRPSCLPTNPASSHQAADRTRDGRGNDGPLLLLRRQRWSIVAVPAARRGGRRASGRGPGREGAGIGYLTGRGRPGSCTRGRCRCRRSARR